MADAAPPTWVKQQLRPGSVLADLRYHAPVSTRQEREDDFQDARAAVLGRQPRLAPGVSVVMLEESEAFVLRYASGRPDEPILPSTARFLRYVDGRRTVADIIDEIVEPMDITDALIAAKAAMADLHTLYVEGVIGELN